MLWLIHRHLLNHEAELECSWRSSWNHRNRFDTADRNPQTWSVSDQLYDVLAAPATQGCSGGGCTPNLPTVTCDWLWRHLSFTEEQLASFYCFRLLWKQKSKWWRHQRYESNQVRALQPIKCVSFDTVDENVNLEDARLEEDNEDPRDPELCGVCSAWFEQHIWKKCRKMDRKKMLLLQWCQEKSAGQGSEEMSGLSTSATFTDIFKGKEHLLLSLHPLYLEFPPKDKVKTPVSWQAACSVAFLFQSSQVFSLEGKNSLWVTNNRHLLWWRPKDTPSPSRTKRNALADEGYHLTRLPSSDISQNATAADCSQSTE